MSFFGHAPVSSEAFSKIVNKNKILNDNQSSFGAILHEMLIWGNFLSIYTLYNT